MIKCPLDSDFKMEASIHSEPVVISYEHESAKRFCATMYQGKDVKV